MFCPSSWDTADDVLDPSFTTVAQVPCAGIRVVAMDADPLWDEYCGAGYTDSRGIALFRAECGDTVNPAPEVYVKVEGRSMNGFSVGIPDFDLWQRIRDSTIASLTGGATMPLYAVNVLREHQTFQWLSPEFQVTSGSLNLGDWQIGASVADGTVPTMAARQFWAAQYSMFRLNAGTQYRPMDFNYTVSGPLPTITTFYDTVVVGFTSNEEPQASQALQATPHEIGHVLYNTYHSGILHWLYEDATDYMTNHAQCDTDHFQTLAWYEGFADFVQDYVLQRWHWPASNWTAAWRPFHGCAITVMPDVTPGVMDDVVVTALQDMHIEGNVQGMLNNIFFGPMRAEQRTEVGQPMPADFTCPAGQRRLVNAAGVVQCERDVPATCTGGILDVDRIGTRDQCVQLVPDPRCSGDQVCEPVEQNRCLVVRLRVRGAVAPARTCAW